MPPSRAEDDRVAKMRLNRELLRTHPLSRFPGVFGLVWAVSGLLSLALECPRTSRNCRFKAVAITAAGDFVIRVANPIYPSIFIVMTVSMVIPQRWPFVGPERERLVVEARALASRRGQRRF